MILFSVIDSLLKIIPYTNAITIPIYDKNEYVIGDKCVIVINRNTYPIKPIIALMSKDKELLVDVVANWVNNTAPNK